MDKILSFEDIVLLMKERGCTHTCSLSNPKENSLTFIKNDKFLSHIKLVDKKIFLLVSPSLYSRVDSPSIEKICTKDDVQEVFVRLHNYLNKDREPSLHRISSGAHIHDSSVIGCSGNKIIAASNGELLRMKHMGNVIINYGVKVDALSVIHRASIDSTVIGENSTICSHVNIGHNVIIGKRVFIAPGTKIAGSVSIGDDCKIWQGVFIKNGIKICSGVEIGMGSIVTRDIDEPGLYYGSPCKFRRKCE